jgi:polyisoprenoid-binding protein YceI
MAVEKWNFDPVHSTIGFSVRHMMISRVNGHFRKWEGWLLADESNPANTKATIKIEAASIDTKEGQRDDHLRSADFFDVEKHPYITFESTKIEKLSDDHYKVTGDLTIKGVTKQVTLDTEYFGKAKDPWGGERLGLSTKTSIDRKDYGLTFNMPLDGGGLLVGDKVDITGDVEAVKESAVAA